MANKQLQYWYLIIGGVFIVNLVMFFHLSRKPTLSDDPVLANRLLVRLENLQERISEQVDIHEAVLRALNGEESAVVDRLLQRMGRNLRSKGSGNQQQEAAAPNPNPDQAHKLAGSESSEDAKTMIPVLVMACNRVTIKRSLDQMFRYRPSADKFPVVVSQDCAHGPTADVIRGYGNQLLHLMQPDQSGFNLPNTQKRFEGYFRISRHYKWALDQVLLKMNHSVALIVEDDLDISPDFFEYFAATYPILRRDPTLWCVSAWNDNGKTDLVAGEPELLYRTDFFPGLGWMILRSTWLEIRENWPATFWDEYMRKPELRRGRACIRPEISRTSTFGRQGVSNGQFFDKHLRFIKLNDRFVPFTHFDMGYLEKARFDRLWHSRVYQEAVEVKFDELMSGRIAAGANRAVRVEYRQKDQFVTMAKGLGVMEDFKAGVPRTAYMGVVSVLRNGVRVYLAPPPNWTGYDPAWN